MKALIISEYKGLEGLHLSDIALPEPRSGEMRIKVIACGLNFADLLMMKGTYQQTPALPFSPGAEVCGIVEMLGEGVDPVWLGRRVSAYCGSGGLAEHVCVKAAACVEAPGSLTDESVAAIPVAYGSAELALRHRARLRAGEFLVVAGAGGGVGLTGVEVGALMGARVIALARGAEKREAALAKGAELALDTDDFDLSGSDLKDRLMEITGGRGVDVIYDPVGGPLTRAMMRASAFEARILPIGFASGDVPVFKGNHLLVKNVDVVGFWWGQYFESAPKVMTESLSRLFDWAAQGRIAPLVSDVFPLEQGAEALALIRDRKATGKIIVRVQAA